MLKRPQLLRSYLCMCILSGLACLWDGTINGPAELLYAISISCHLSRV